MTNTESTIARTPFIRMLSGSVIFLATAEVLAIGLSLCHITIGRTAAISVAAAALLIAFIATRGDKHEAAPDNARRQISRRGRIAAICVITFSVLVYLTLVGAAWRQPDLSCDGNAYHIPPLHLWAQQGYICWIDPNFTCSDYMNGYPKGVEVIAFLLVRAFDSNFANMTNLIFLVPGVLGIASISSMLGSARLIALAAGTLYILVPVNIMQSNTTYIDSAYASCVIAAIALATASLNAKNKSSLLLIGLGAAVGLALSSRPTAIILAAFIAIALPAWHYVLHRTWAISATKLLIAAAIALLVCGYWYGRNYYYTGSPVYPAGVCAAGYTIFPGQSIESTMHASKNVPPIMRDWSACRRIFATWTQFPEQWPQTVTMVDARFGGLGFMFLPCVAAIVVVLALLVQHKSNSEIRTLLFPLAIVIVLFIATPSNWWPRYTLWLYAIALPSLAVCISGRLGSRDATWERFGFLILCFVFIVAATEGVVCAVAIMRQGLAKDGLIYRAESHVAAASEIPFAVLGGSAFDAVLASNDAVAAGPLESQFDEKRWKVELLGVLSMPVGGRRLRAIPKDVNQTDLNHMAAEVNWIIWDETVTVPEGLKRFPSQCIHGFRLFKITH